MYINHTCSDDRKFFSRAQEPEKAMESVSVIPRIPASFVNSALGDFTILIETTKKYYALHAIAPVKVRAPKLGRKVAWPVTTDGLWIPN